MNDLWSKRELALKEKRKKQTKQNKTYKSSSTLLQSSTQLNGDQSNASALNVSNLTSINSQLTPIFSTTSKINSPNYYIQKVSDCIEKFCVNTFKSIILSNDIDYVISVTILDADINGYIKCGCNTNIKLIFRSKSNVFQLSAYFKHVKSSRCIMIKKKKQGLNNISSTNNNLSNLVVQDNTSNINNSQDISDELILNDEDESFQTTINDSITTASNSYGTTKRSLSSQSTSSTTKKIRSSL
jgi:hypothetical protein